MKQIAFKDVRVTTERTSLKYELYFPIYLSEKCQMHVNYNHYTSNGLFYHQIVNLNQMIDQARQGDNESTAVTFIKLSSPDFVHGISRAFEIVLTVVHSVQKPLLNGKRFCD